MDRKREEAGRMVRRKTLRIRQALTARSGDMFTERATCKPSRSSSRSDAGSLSLIWEGLQPCCLFWTIGHIGSSHGEVAEQVYDGPLEPRSGRPEG
jgi:hypothetical protein